MPVLALKSTVFDVLEGVLATPSPTLAYEDALDTLINGEAQGKAKILQLSSSLIRISQAMWDDSSGTPKLVTFELRLSGSGIGPVSSMNALMEAINNGLAKGTLSKFEILQSSQSVLAVTLDHAGYHLTSGDISVNLTGTLPLSFTQFFDLADLFDKVVHLDELTRVQRAALFDDLSAYSTTGLTLTEAGHVLFATHISATTASLTLNGLTLTLTGHFPANFGQDVQVLWDLFNQASSARDLAAGSFSGLSITSLKFTDAAGHILGTMADPLADTPFVGKVDGRSYDQLAMGQNSDDHLTGAFHDKLVLAGLDGRDVLQGGGRGDLLLGGTGNDTMSGNGGTDRLDGGTGRDVMTGGAAADVFRFDLGDGIDRISDFTAHEDVIQILAASRTSDLTFTQVGDDVQLDYRSIHILVEHITVAQLDQVANFQF